MLPEIAAEALHFLSRRDLDKASGISKWLDAMIAQCCDVYPFRPVRMVQLYSKGSKFNVWTEDLSSDNSFSTLDGAVHFAEAILRYSFTGSLQVCDNLSRSMTLVPDHWATLIDAIRSGGVRHFHYSGVKFDALGDDAFLVALDSRGLQSFEVHRSVVPIGFATDDLIRASIAKGLLLLRMSGNQCDSPQRVSDEIVLDFFFRADPAPPEQPLSLLIECRGLTDTFLKKFFERLQSNPVRPSGTLNFCGSTPAQRGLSAYDHFLAPGGTHDGDATYRFPPMDNDVSSYQVQLSEGSTYFCIYFGRASQ